MCYYINFRKKKPWTRQQYTTCGGNIVKWLVDLLLHHEDKRYRNSMFSFSFFYLPWAQRKGFPFTSNISVYEERFPLSIWPKETTKQSDVYCSGQTDRIQNIGYFIGYSSLIAISKNIIPPIFSITCFQL